MASGDVTQILRPSRESTNVWSCYWGGYREGSPSRSLRPEVAAAAKSEGSKGAILGGTPLQEHTQPGNKSFPGMAPSDGVCHWAQLCTGCERRAKDGVLLAMSF